MHCPVTEPLAFLRGIKVDAVAAGDGQTLALAEDGSVYAWGSGSAAGVGALGLGSAVERQGRLCSQHFASRRWVVGDDEIVVVAV
jgi:alpha-tubulin suppressor-like RCC1 family protein